MLSVRLTRIFHGDSSRGIAQRDADKADEDFGAGLYSTYCPSLNRSPTQSASGSRKQQQIHREICGLAPPMEKKLAGFAKKAARQKRPVFVKLSSNILKIWRIF